MKLNDTKRVVVKTIPDCVNYEELKQKRDQFLRQIATVCDLAQCQQMVKFVGAYIQDDKPFMLFDYMSEGGYFI
jgi:hypothetical protein